MPCETCKWLINSTCAKCDKTINAPSLYSCLLHEAKPNDSDSYDWDLSNAGKAEDSKFDAISKPSHYTEGRKYEPKDVIRDWNLNFNLGNVIKYVSRAGRKDDILQDLRKARQYLDFEIEYLEKEKKQ